MSEGQNEGDAARYAGRLGRRGSMLPASGAWYCKWPSYVLIRAVSTSLYVYSISATLLVLMVISIASIADRHDSYTNSPRLPPATHILCYRFFITHTSSSAVVFITAVLHLFQSVIAMNVYLLALANASSARWPPSRSRTPTRPHIQKTMTWTGLYGVRSSRCGSG